MKIHIPLIIRIVGLVFITKVNPIWNREIFKSTMKQESNILKFENGLIFMQDQGHTKALFLLGGGVNFAKGTITWFMYQLSNKKYLILSTMFQISKWPAKKVFALLIRKFCRRLLVFSFRCPVEKRGLSQLRSSITITYKAIEAAVMFPCGNHVVSTC